MPHGALRTEIGSILFGMISRQLDRGKKRRIKMVGSACLTTAGYQILKTDRRVWCTVMYEYHHQRKSMVKCSSLAGGNLRCSFVVGDW